MTLDEIIKLVELKYFVRYDDDILWITAPKGIMIRDLRLLRSYYTEAKDIRVNWR